MREMGESTKKFTNVFIKNFGESLDKEGLQKLFEPFGNITSCAVMTDAEGKSKGFGFVAYEQPEQAEKVDCLAATFSSLVKHPTYFVL